ncbi:alpha/beta hydrolase [Deinococcus budaensis]|uniref:Alpha/beta hydrolase n=1 Tax=Deinococcus budaensis TaxID=1665626 RepID=A0A7W8GGC8_9DEIO|nr:hypothetical protein [Deinococcus budaensis]MBB5235179.1 hypothetical protein [Deinococcus budaensis]
MTATPFEEWQRDLFAHHGAGRLREALAVLAAPPADLTPAQRARADFWAACLHAQLGEPGAALTALERVRDRGEWLAPALLERDPDLAPLRSLPRFGALLAAWRARQREEAGRHSPSLTVWAAREAVRGTLMALHGNAQAPDSLRPLYADLTAQGWRVALAGSGQFGGPGALVWDDPAQADAEVAGWAREVGGRPVWAGFSAGAGVALRAALGGAVPASGVLAVSPSLPAGLLELTAPARVPVALVLGEADPHTPRARTLAGRLRGAGVPVNEWTHPGGHTHPDGWAALRAGALAWLTSAV